MAKQWYVQSGTAALVLSVMAVACGGKKTPPKTPVEAVVPGAPVKGEVHERIAPHFCATRTKLAQLLGNADAEAREAHRLPGHAR